MYSVCGRDCVKTNRQKRVTNSAITSMVYRGIQLCAKQIMGEIDIEKSIVNKYVFRVKRIFSILQYV